MYRKAQSLSTPSAHIPVLGEPLLSLLQYPKNAIIVDATIGQAGHALMTAERLGADGLLIGLDVDRASLEQATKKLKGIDCAVKLVNSNFGRLDKALAELGIEKVDVIIADLGVSSQQLDDPRRGMSFRYDGPLDMRLSGLTLPDGCEGLKTAAELVNRLNEKSLADLIYQYGEERKSRRIARVIVEARKIEKIETSAQLVEIVNRAVGYRGGYRKSKIHPATRTFQALRIAVNDELGQLERLLNMAERLLNINGQIAIISFHSLEDRLVKNSFRANKQNGCFEILTKKPIVADDDEIKRNPRSRSAKLRMARKTAEYKPQTQQSIY